jgi:hypothetical protein
VRINMNKAIFLLPILLLIITVSTVHVASAFKKTATSNEDGFQQGVKDGTRDSQGLNGHGFDDSCPKGHTATFCEGYKQGYTESYYDTPENDK